MIIPLRGVTLGPKNVPSDGPGQIHRFSRWVGNFHSLLTQWERVQESHPLTKSATKTNKKWPWSGKQNVSQELLAQFKFFFERFLNVCLEKLHIFREISFRPSSEEHKLVLRYSHFFNKTTMDT